MSHPPQHKPHPKPVPHAATYSKDNGDFLLQAAQTSGITNKAELANFMGQMQVESQGFTKMHESLKYSGDRLLTVLTDKHGHVRNNQSAEEVHVAARGGEKTTAAALYGGEWGKAIGNRPNTDDSYTFRGRGFVQLTGRYNYERYGKVIGVDLVNHPDLASDPGNAAKIALQYWKETVAKRGHQTDVTHATEDINGGHNGLKERKSAAAQWEAKLALGYKPGDPEPGRSLQESLLFKQAQAALQRIDAQFDRKPDQLTDNAAAAVAVVAQRAGLRRIDHLELGGPDNGSIFAVQGKPGTAHSKVVSVPTTDAIHTPIAQSAKAFEDAQQHVASTQQRQQVDPPANQQAAPAALSR